MICKSLFVLYETKTRYSLLLFRLPEDILDSNPTVGSTIRIRWTDGTIYSCKYLGRKRVLLYRIQLDRDIRQLQRHEFSLVDVRPH